MFKLRKVYVYLAELGLTKLVPDELHLRFMYKSMMHERLHLGNPITFDEKMQWLKLYDRNPLYTVLVDKYHVKKWVADRIGSEYVADSYGVWNCLDDIDVSMLPDRFVLKTNHDCGGIAICRNRTEFDFDSAKRKLDRHLRINYFYRTREWPYKNVEPCVFAEEYLEPDEAGDLPDYKLFCFGNGRVITLVMTDRFTSGQITKTFFDENWRMLDVTEGGHPRKQDMPKPRNFALMKELASELSKGFPFVRVDFYEVREKVKFGEMTFYPNSGFERFDPVDWDERFGSWIPLEKAYDVVEADSAGEKFR